MTGERKPMGLGRPGSGKRAALPARALPDLTPRGSLDDADDEGNPWDEHTPVLDMQGVYKKVGQTASMVKVLIDKLPQIEGKVDIAIGAARNAQREAYEAKNAATLAQTAATSAQQRVEDVCHRVEGLEPLKTNGATSAVRLGAVEKELEKTSERRWSLWWSLIAIVLTILSSLGVAIWWASGVDSEAAHETQRREAADKVLIESIDRRPTRDEVLTRNELKELRDELVKQRQPTVEEWIRTLPAAKQREVKRLVGAGPSAAQ